MCTQFLIGLEIELVKLCTAPKSILQVHPHLLFLVVWRLQDLAENGYTLQSCMNLKTIGLYYLFNIPNLHYIPI